MYDKVGKKKTKLVSHETFCPVTKDWLPVAPYRWKAVQAVVRISFINYPSKCEKRLTEGKIIVIWNAENHCGFPRFILRRIK